MADQADTKTDTKADAAAEKAYAQAADAVSPKKDDAPAKTATPKIDAAVREVKAAPAKAKRAAKPAAAKRQAPKKAAAKRPAPQKAVAKVARAQRKAAAAPAKATVSTAQTLKDKFMTTTANTDFAKNLKETAAQAQTRAKAAYDRVQAYTGEMTDLAKGNVEALVESGRILGTGMQELARGEIEAAKSAFETATADLKAMAAVKSPTELFKLQGEIARRNFDAAVARASKNAEVSMKLASDAFAPISNRMSVAAERISKAA